MPLGEVFGVGNRKQFSIIAKLKSPLPFWAFGPWAWVATKVELSRRRDNLSWSHHPRRALAERGPVREQGAGNRYFWYGIGLITGDEEL